jgi:AraC family transcriptional regulator
VEAEMRATGRDQIPPSSGFGSVRALYDGWITAEKPKLDEYVTESLLCFQGGWVETRQYRWSAPVEATCQTTNRCYFLNLSLAGSQTAGSAKNLRAMHSHDAEPVGRIFMLPPGQIMQFSSPEGQSRSIRCMLDAKLFESFGADLPDWNADESSIQAALHIGSGQIEWVLRRMYRELDEPDFMTPSVIESLARQLTAEVIRTFNVRREDASHRAGGLPPWRMRLIRQRVWAEQPLPGVDELAGLCGMTVRHLGRAFRRETGQTIGKYIESAMIDRAKKMLSDGTAVAEVAKSLGYSTSGSFAAAFRRATGLLPREISATGGARSRAGHRHRPAPRPTCRQRRPSAAVS